MKKTFTTSAQKILSLPKEVILKKLEHEMIKDTSLVFQATKRGNIKEAKVKDGSKIVIATFDKNNGKTLAMIDHKDLPDDKVRSEIQKSIREKLDKIFPKV